MVGRLCLIVAEELRLTYQHVSRSGPRTLSKDDVQQTWKLGVHTSVPLKGQALNPLLGHDDQNAPGAELRHLEQKP